MYEKIGELLVQQSVIDQTQLEEALQAQAMFGGKIGSVLVEMGLVSEVALASALAKTMGIPCVSRQQLFDVPPNIIQAIAPELAREYQVVPLSLNGRELTLVMADPLDLNAIKAISKRTGYIVIPVLALDTQISIVLEKYYGNERRQENLSLPNQEPDNLFDCEKTLYRNSASPEEIQSPNSSPVLVAQPLSCQPLAKSKPPLASLIIEADKGLTEIDAGMAQTAEKLAYARDRNDVADAIIKFLGSRYMRAALFTVTVSTINGWRMVHDGKLNADIQQLQIPLNENSVFKTAIEAQSFFLGPIPQSGFNLALTAFLGNPSPKSALLVPMAMIGRVVSLLYVDDPSKELSDSVAFLQKLSNKTLMAFEVLILQQKILQK